MKNKNRIYGYVGILVIFLMLLLPSVPAKKETRPSTEVYESGWFILVSPNITGIEPDVRFGGLQDLNITIHGGNTFVLRTKPIWGSTIMCKYVDLHIQMTNFFGFIDIYNRSGACEGEIVGICKGISWQEL